MLRALLERSVTGLLRVGSALALLGLSVMCASLLWPSALPVIFAMSVGHVIGFGAFACYLLAVIIDARRRGPSVSLPPASGPQERTPDDDVHSSPPVASDSNAG